ncbi:hypothetical protein [Sigmofec virus UA08Rod_5336]|uniref:Uncharacterized protein n=1 Tax=Sigmofec virus UA08Rod_5336 TaxID=2929419 RepID=A0A976N1J1_9VIRU|nr:hypothetical protein [Sigmofec virus UA08Rod_5336]
MLTKRQIKKIKNSSKYKFFEDAKKAIDLWYKNHMYTKAENAPWKNEFYNEIYLNYSYITNRFKINYIKEREEYYERKNQENIDKSRKMGRLDSSSLPSTTNHFLKKYSKRNKKC